MGHANKYLDRDRRGRGAREQAQKKHGVLPAAGLTQSREPRHRHGVGQAQSMLLPGYERN